MAKAHETRTIDLGQALLDPGSVFARPEDVVATDRLSKSQKIEVLRRWQYDASEICVAVEEGMPDGNRDLLHRILVALGELGAEVDVERVAPSKQHGIPG